VVSGGALEQRPDAEMMRPRNCRKRRLAAADREDSRAIAAPIDSATKEPLNVEPPAKLLSDAQCGIFYEEDVVCVLSAACKFVAPQVQPLCRLFSTDWDVAYDGEMPPATAALGNSEALREKFSGTIKRPVETRSGIQLQDLFAQLPPLTYLGLAENARTTTTHS
jgi:hypothetical protein